MRLQKVDTFKLEVDLFYLTPLQIIWYLFFQARKFTWNQLLILFDILMFIFSACEFYWNQ